MKSHSSSVYSEREAARDAPPALKKIGENAKLTTDQKDLLSVN